MNATAADRSLRGPVGARHAPAELVSVARELPGLRETVQALAAPGVSRLVWKGLAGGERAWLLAGLARESGRTVLWVHPDAERADTAREDLELFLDTDEILYFPEPETLPYESRSPHPSLLAQRLEALYTLADPDARAAGRVIVTTVRALAQRVPSAAQLWRARLPLHVGESFDLESLTGRLVALGYERRPMVSAVGEFAVRGGIVDVFALGSDDPWRLEFDDQVLASLRRFDHTSQRSVEGMTAAVVLPRFEVALLPEDLPSVHERLSSARGVAASEGGLDIDELGLLHEGVERLAGYYDQDLVPFPALLPADAMCVLDRPDQLEARGRALDGEIRHHYEEALVPYPLLSPPEDLYLEGVAAIAHAAQGDTLVIAGPAGASEAVGGPAGRAWTWSVRLPEAFGRRLDLLRAHLARLHEEGLRIVILCDNEGQRDRLSELIGPTAAVLEVGILSSGFAIAEAGLAVLTDHEIFDRPRRRVRRRRKTGGLSLAELNALEPGNYVVHADHGVGIYRGLRRLTVDGQETDCLELAYAAGDKLFVPVTQLSLVSRWASEEGAQPSMHRLGTTTWARTKAKAKKAIQEMAEELLRSYAERQSRPGFAFPPDTEWQRELEAAFIYEETPDQRRAVEEVKADMERPRPMDRLVCGDVGYGKTEVAVRAAFKAVQAGKQVAVLVPTTILAQQHWQTFRERLADFPVRIEVLSRFRLPKEQKDVVERLGKGEVDLVIGTHRLLSKDVRFHDLGLVVIDEEQRFGVAHKERLRQMRRQVDVLTLTATPIPRTLHFSMAGARDMSIIETPPRDRQPVHTEVAELTDDLIVDALLREVDRGGQAFFVHNRVESIDRSAIHLAKILPQLRFAIAHGQMRERALEKVMLDFYEKRHDVLVCTMIVENGLDLPNVNTLIVDRSENLGLAQLYQLRGRVGRSRARAHAYFLVPPRRALTEDAEKRLKIIEAFDDLGAGFKIALKDLEIRGAGNLLGPEQSGFILGLGFDLYVKLLEETIADLKGVPLEETLEPRLHTDRPAFLPESYVPDDEQKLELYRQLAVARRPERVDELEAELADRFGPPPKPARQLLELRRLRLLGARARVSRLSIVEGTLELFLDQPLKPEEIHAVLTSTHLPLEFLSGREMGMRLKTSKDTVVTEARILLEALVACGSVRPK
ncbi:MAG TPA: transcription-repair coupling factor [Candidatus Eisenbacteria bacterium]|nr:transcription-repair coupling factor [Candidatus Eisenbacteria bacterium]